MPRDSAKTLPFLYATIFLTSASIGSITFLLPVYAEELGATYVSLGLMGAAGSTAYTVMTLVSGALLDRFERVRLYLLFSVFVASVILMFYTATRVSDLIALRGLLGIASAMFFVTASTLVADNSPQEAMTKNVGRYNMSWIAGFIAGPFLGGIVSDAVGFPALFIASSLITVVSIVIICRSLVGNRLSERHPGRGFDLSALRGLYIALLALIPYSVVLGVYMAILPGHMRELGIASSIIGSMLTMTNTVRGLGFINVRRFVSWGERRSIGLASCLMGAALSMVAFSKDTMGFVVPLAMFGLAGGIITPVILNIIASRSPRDALGTVMGVHESVYGFGMVLGPMVGGAVAEAFQPSTLYISLAALSLVILPLSRKINT